MPFVLVRSDKDYKIVKGGSAPPFFYALKRVRPAPLEPKDGACGRGAGLTLDDWQNEES